MRLQRLRLRDFRNLESVDLELPGGICVFWGDNGQGKTNLLEAVHLLATLKSFRTQRSAPLVRHGTALAFVGARISCGGLPRDCQVTVDRAGRHLLLDGKDPRSLSDWFTSIKAVGFVPSDLRLVDGPPEGRRDFLDRGAFTLDPGFLAVAREYRRVVQSKNALLRDARRRGRAPDRDLLAAWDDRLVAAGSRIVHGRTSLLRDFAPVFRDLHDVIAGTAPGRAEFRYRGCVGADAVAEGLEAIASALRARVLAAAPAEAALGHCTIGPHRDDWDLHIGGEMLRTFGSQGQTRSAALCLRVGQLVLARLRTGLCPIFLLDDVSSELDPHRNRQLMRLLQDLQAHVLLTTTDLQNLRIDRGAFESWKVVAGRVEPG